MKNIPNVWEVDVRKYEEVDVVLTRLINKGISFRNYNAQYFPEDKSIVALVNRIIELLTDTAAGFAILNLGKALHRNTKLADQARLLALIIGNNFGSTLTKNHIDNSPFFPVFHRTQGKGKKYIGNALSNNRPGVHTDGSALRHDRIDLVGLLCVQQAAAGGESLIVNALKVFHALPSEVQQFVLNRRFVRQNPYDPQTPNPVRRTIYHKFHTPIHSGLGIMYHRSRIEGGQQLVGKPLDGHDTAMLDILDKFLNHSSFMHKILLKSGQILFINNNFMCHDRLAFRDSPNKSRRLERYWAGVTTTVDESFWRSAARQSLRCGRSLVAR